MVLALDVLTLAVFAWMVFSCYRRGFVRSVIEFAGYILSYAVSIALSKPVGGWIYTTFLKPLVYGKIQSYISDSIGTAGAQAVEQAKTLTAADLSQYIDKLPAQFRSLLNLYGLDTGTLQSAASTAVQSGSHSAAGALTEAVVAPIFTVIGYDLAFVAIFALCMVAVRMLARMTNGVSRLPVIGPANRFLGALVGVGKGLLVMFFVCTLVSALVPVLSMQKNPVLTQDIIDKTHVFKLIYTINPLTQILLKS